MEGMGRVQGFPKVEGMDSFFHPSTFAQPCAWLEAKSDLQYDCLVEGVAQIDRAAYIDMFYLSGVACCIDVQ